MTDANCLHCKISLAIIEHFRSKQSKAPGQYPDLRCEEVAEITINLAQVVADTITPCEQGEPQLLRRAGLFTGYVIKRAMADMRQAASDAPAHGARLQ